MSRPELIAEISTNHGGSIALAKEFIKRYAPYADFCKFQTTRVKHLDPSDLQYEWFQKAELSDDAHCELKACCEDEGTTFLTTVFNAAEVPFVSSLGLKAVKIGSGESEDVGLADALDRAPFSRLFVSTGIRSAFPFTGAQDYRLTIFRCCSRYPTPDWLARERLTQPFVGPELGWSDHSLGIEMCQRAIARGAQIIEKHVSLPNQARPHQGYEATEREFALLRQWADDDPERFLGRWQYA